MNITIDPSVIKSELEKSITKKELYMEYQPKINIVEGKVAGSEALIRWKHPIFGNVPPAKFIPFACEHNLDHKIMEYVVDSVCEQVKQWHKDKVPVSNISFNLSPKSFLNSKLVNKITAIFNKHELSTEFFEIEITEEAILQRPDLVHQQFSQLKDLGFKITLDHLGIGDASFSRLTEYPFDTIKIDRSYIRDIDRSYDSRYIVKSFIEICKRIGKKVAAEGVENKEQLMILKELDCDEIQGFYYSPSIPGDEMAKWYEMERVFVNSF